MIVFQQTSPIFLKITKNTKNIDENSDFSYEDRYQKIALIPIRSPKSCGSNVISVKYTWRVQNPDQVINTNKNEINLDAEMFFNAYDYIE